MGPEGRCPRRQGEPVWYQKKRFIFPIALVVIVVLVSALSGGHEEPAATVIDGNTADAVVAGDDEKKDAAGSGKPAPAGSKGKPVGDAVENVKSESKLFSDSAARFVASDDTSYGTDTDATIAVSADGDALMFEETYISLKLK